MRKPLGLRFMVIASLFAFVPLLFSQGNDQEAALDKKVRAFLKSHAREWHDWNVPETDGKLLYDMIIKNKYTKALEIGTSTGHSAIWIGWALSKTGGKLITVKIDETRHKRALENFKEAGLSEYIDARLADAHELIPKLEGPFDFVFSDAETDWYKNYFDAVAPKLVVGGRYTTHDVSDSYLRYLKGRIKHLLSNGTGGTSESDYADYLRSLKNFETTFDDNGAGVAISYKKSEK
jgi:caffeoyl-CoA O-methyltransferase